MPYCRLLLATIVLTGAAASTAFAAESYPARPIRMVVPLPPGTASDFLARTLAQPLSEQFGQQVVVDNRPGAGGLIGSGIVAKAIPDGYTMAMIAAPHVVAPLLQSKPPYHPIDDFVAVAEVALIPNVLVVSPNTPAATVKELVALAKSKPGQLNYASVGVGTLAHIGAEIFNRAAGIKAVHVPFKVVGDAYAETLSDRVHYFLFTVPTAMPMLRDGRLRAIAVSSAKRTAALPDVPTLAEAGLPGAQSEGWFGIVAPAGTPRKVIAHFHAHVAKLLKEARVKEAFARQSAEPTADVTPEGYGGLLKSEYQRYKDLVRDTGMKTQ